MRVGSVRCRRLGRWEGGCDRWRCQGRCRGGVSRGGWGDPCRWVVAVEQGLYCGIGDVLERGLEPHLLIDEILASPGEFLDDLVLENVGPMDASGVGKKGRLRWHGLG